MKTNFTLFKRAMAMLSLIVATVSCSQDAMDSEAVVSNDDRVVTFTINEPAATRGSILTNDTFESLTIYVVNSERDTPSKINMAKDANGVWEQTSIVSLPSSGTTTFYAVSDQRAGSEASGVTFEYNEGEPYVSYSMPTDVASQPTLVMAEPVELEANTSSFSVTLNFHYTLSIVGFTTSGDYDIESLSITNFKNGANIAFGETYTADNFSEYTTATSELSIKLLESEKYSDVNYLMIPVQNLEGAVITADLSYKGVAVDESKIITLSAKDDLLTCGYLKYLNINTGEYVDPVIPGTPFESGDYTSMESANCYILNPTDKERVFYIPVEDRINTFWGKTSSYYESNSSYQVNTNGTNWTPSILWADVDNYANVQVERVNSGFESTDCASAMKVTLPANFNAANIVVAVKINSTIVWSWHLWVTDYNPYIEPVDTGSGAYKVDNGELFRYEDNNNSIYLPNNCGYNIKGRKNLWENGGDYVNGYIMDRNIGATASDASGYGTNYAGKGSLYYQFGRKDPFPANATTYGPTQPEVFDGYAEMDAAVRLPYKFVASGKSEWYYISNLSYPPKYAEDNVFWRDPATSTNILERSASGFEGTYYDNYTWDYDLYLDPNMKSIFDPSPLGWKIPHFMTWSNITEDGNVISGGIECKGSKYFENGYLSRSNGNVVYNGSQIYSWSNYPLLLVEISYNNAYTYTFQGSALYYGNGGVIECEEVSRATGLPIRPVRDLSIEF